MASLRDSSLWTAFSQPFRFRHPLRHRLRRLRARLSFRTEVSSETRCEATLTGADGIVMRRRRVGHPTAGGAKMASRVSSVWSGCIVAVLMAGPRLPARGERLGSNGGSFPPRGRERHVGRSLVVTLLVVASMVSTACARSATPTPEHEVSAGAAAQPPVPTSRETGPSGYLCTDGRRMASPTCRKHPQFLIVKGPSRPSAHSVVAA